jgi:phosphohistidine phosphatase
MKRIYITRHAKSSWSDFSLSDHDRPLDARGLSDAPIMAQKLARLVPRPDCLIASSAKRTIQTAELFAKEYDIDKSKIKIYKSLYHSEPDDMLKVINDQANDSNTIAMFVHNPGITYFASLVGDLDINDVSTCGILILSCKVDSWDEVSLLNINLDQYIYPKM